MSNDARVEAAADLQRYGNVVPSGYSYARKVVTAGEELALPRAVLKWYEIRPPEVAITREQVEESRAFASAEVERLKLDDELGFVLLHRAGPGLLLMIMTWRSTNEVWESAYVKDLSRPGGYVPFEFETTHRATFCVWELGAVWHERNAWVRFLSSKRDAAAKRDYLDDRFEGLV